MAAEKKITALGEEEGQSISVVGDSYRILISGQQTKGSYAVIDMLVPPGGGPGPHAHKNVQEMFYVVDGEIEFKTEEGKYIAKKNSFVNIPLGGAIHSFKNLTGNIAHLLCTVVPAGMDDFFKEIGKPIDAGSFLPAPDLSPAEKKQMESIAEKYGQELYPPNYLDK